MELSRRKKKNVVVDLGSTVEVYSPSGLTLHTVMDAGVYYGQFSSVFIRLGQDGYAAVGVRQADGISRSVRLHSLLISGEGVVDHINRVRNDNRLINLRRCSVAENISNSPKPRRKRATTSAYKGVHYNASRGKFVSQFRHKTLGYFATEVEAATAYALAGGVQ